MHLAILGGSKGDGGLLVTEIPTVACPTLQGIPLLQGHRDAHHLTVGDALRGGDAPTRTHRGGDGAIHRRWWARIINGNLLTVAVFGGRRWWWTRSQHRVHLAISGCWEGDGGLTRAECSTGACPTFQGIPLIKGHRDAHGLTIGNRLGVGDAAARTHRGGDDAIHRRWWWTRC